MTQVRLGEIGSDQLRVGNGGADLLQGPAGAGSHIENFEGTRSTVCEVLQAAFQRSQNPASHGIGGAIEEDLHLQVVKTSRMVTQVAVGLMVKILEVVLGVERFFGFLGQIPHIALAASIPGGGKIHPNLRVAADPVEPGCIKQQLLGVDPLFGVLPVLFLEFPHIQLQLSKNFGGHGLGFRHRIRRQQLHQLGAQLLVGQARDAFALLKRLVRKLAQGR